MKSRAHPLRGFSYIRFIIFPDTYTCIYDIMSAREPTCLHDWRTANWIMIVAKQR